MKSYTKKKIVRLKRGGRAYKKLQITVLERDNYTCKECRGYTEAPPHHIIKLSQGGSDTLDNMATLCGPMENNCHDKYPNWTEKT